MRGKAMPDRPQTPHAEDGIFDIVDVASDQSFPASDPPAWATGQQDPDTSMLSLSEIRPLHAGDDRPGHPAPKPERGGLAM
jgi:hypothetical protein